jgi:hypothetical protein
MSLEQDSQARGVEDGIRRFSSHKNTPRDALELFEAALGKCPVAHSDENDGFFLLLGYDEVKRGASDHAVFSSKPQVLRPLLDRPSLAALEMDPPGTSTGVLSSTRR